MKKNFIFLFMAVLLLGGAALVQAAPYEADDLEEDETLSLTRGQREELARILKQNYTTVAPLRQQLAAKRGELASELDSANPDKDKITGLSREIGDIRGKLLSARVDLRGQLAAAGLPEARERNDSRAYPGRDAWDGRGYCPYYHGYYGGDCRGYHNYHGGYGPHGSYGRCPWMDGRMMMGPGMGW